MAKVYDVPADVLIERLSTILKSEDIPTPSWTPFVKTGAHADKPPQDREWWYTRCASVMRKIYLRGPIGINELRKVYGGGKPSGYGAAHHKSAGGAIIRNAIQGLEKLGYIELPFERKLEFTQFLRWRLALIKICSKINTFS